jgi:hypothetical protein
MFVNIYEVWFGNRIYCTLTQLLPTSNYSAIANLHALQFTTVRTTTSQSAVSSPVVAWQRLSTP